MRQPLLLVDLPLAAAEAEREAASGALQPGAEADAHGTYTAPLRACSLDTDHLALSLALGLAGVLRVLAQAARLVAVAGGFYGEGL